jgi:hypothetical protein
MKLPKTATVYHGGRKYVDEAPDDLVAVGAIEKAVAQAKAGIERFKKYPEHKAIVKGLEAESADLEEALKTAPAKAPAPAEPSKTKSGKGTK